MDDFFKDIFESIYREWIFQQKIQHCFILKTSYGLANVTFYPLSIIEFNVVNKTNEQICFFLYFQINNNLHTIDLFHEINN